MFIDHEQFTGGLLREGDRYLMARSGYIYLVMPEIEDTPIAAFTVKHELKTFLDSCDLRVRLFRIRDGETAKEDWMKYELVVQLDPGTLEPFAR